MISIHLHPKNWGGKETSIWVLLCFCLNSLGALLSDRKEKPPSLLPQLTRKIKSVEGSHGTSHQLPISFLSASVNGKGQPRCQVPIWALPSVPICVTSVKLLWVRVSSSEKGRRIIAFSYLDFLRVKLLNICKVLRVLLHVLALVHLFPFLATMFVQRRNRGVLPHSTHTLSSMKNL